MCFPITSGAIYDQIFYIDLHLTSVWAASVYLPIKFGLSPILLDSYYPRSCHPFHSMKLVSYPVYKSTQNKQSPSSKCLLHRRHLSSLGSKRQSRARSSRPSIKTKADEAVLGNSALYEEDDYNYIPYEEDSYKTKSPQGDAVKVWLFHNHYL